MTVRVVARRPVGSMLAFVVEGSSLADVTAQALPFIRRLADLVPRDAVWTAEPWRHARPT